MTRHGILRGTGFAILLRNLEQRRARIVPIYLRRLAMLAVFGFIAEAFFGFHILLEYAMWGLPLLFIRRWSARALFVTAVLALATIPVVHAVRNWSRSRTPAARRSSS